MQNVVIYVGARAYEEGGGFSRYIVPGTETQEGDRESLKSTKALAINVLFLIFSMGGGGELCKIHLNF